MAEMTMTYEELCKSRCEGCREKWPTYARGYPMANPGSFPNEPPVWGRTVHCPPGASRVMADEANQLNDGQIFCAAPSIQAAYTESRVQVAALTAERDNLKADALTVWHLRNVRECIAAGKASGADLSDAEVAGRVRMLTRYQLDHEFICVMARDRIIALSDSVTTLEAELAAAKQATERLDAALNRFYEAWPDVRQLIDGWKQGTPADEWSEWDEQVRDTTVRLSFVLLAARAPEGTPPPPTEMRCVICKDHAVYHAGEAVWRHKHDGLEGGQSLCEKYGYPIEVETAEGTEGKERP